MNNKWVKGVHKGRLVCPSCEGLGVVEGYPCLVCGGEGGHERGCGALATVDRHYGLAECALCGMVPVEEVAET